MYIYQIKNIVTGKLYIGKTIQCPKKRYTRHIQEATNGTNRRLYSSIQHHGIDNFDLTVLCECGSIDELNEMEMYWIDQLDTLIPNGYNMTIGGDGGYTLESWDDEDKVLLYAKQAKSRKGQKRTNESKQRMSDAAKIRQQSYSKEESEAIKKKQSKTLKEKYSRGEIKINNPVLYGESNHNYTHIDIDRVLVMIKNRYKLADIAKEFCTTTATVGNKLKVATGKTFSDWRKHYGIRGTFSNPK